MKVLMIEDNVESIQGLIDAASDRGWEHQVASFETAGENIYSFDPDVIVMDWMFDEDDAEKGRPILEHIVSNEFMLASGDNRHSGSGEKRQFWSTENSHLQFE